MTDKPKATQTDTVADHVLMKRGLYYCPNNTGYTGRKDRAGLYPSSDARPDCGVTAIPSDKAPLFAPKCWDEVKVEYYEERIAAEQSRDAVIEQAVLKAIHEARLPYERQSAGRDDSGVALTLQRQRRWTFEAVQDAFRKLKSTQAGEIFSQEK